MLYSIVVPNDAATYVTHVQAIENTLGQHHVFMTQLAMAVRGLVQGLEHQSETTKDNANDLESTNLAMFTLQKDLEASKRTLEKKLASVDARLATLQDVGTETTISTRIEAIEQVVNKMHAHTTQVEQKVSGMQRSEAKDGRFPQECWSAKHRR